MTLSLHFSRRNSIFHIRFFLFKLLYFTLVKLKQSSACHYLVFADKLFFVPEITKKKIFNSKGASQILYPSFVCKFPHERDDITKNAWRTPLNARCNIDYNIL